MTPPFNARIIPKQTAGPLETGFGFWFEGRILKWKTHEEAMMGACCLGLAPWTNAVVGYVALLIPEGWTDEPL